MDLYAEWLDYLAKWNMTSIDRRFLKALLSNDDSLFMFNLLYAFNLEIVRSQTESKLMDILYTKFVFPSRDLRGMSILYKVGDMTFCGVAVVLTIEIEFVNPIRFL